MSYILDALRRAEVERERGKVPGVHDQPLAGVPSATSERNPARRGAWVAGGAVALLAVAAIAWVSMDHGDGAHVLASAPTPTGSSNRVVTTAPSSIAPVAPVAPVVAAPIAASPPVATITPTPTLTLPMPTTTAPRELTAVPALPHSETMVRNATPAPAPTPTSAAPVAAANPTPTGGSRIYEANELPDDVRRALPPLTFGGAMYADTPSARLLIVNGQVAHEGDPVARGLVLEQIRLKSAVLAFRGYRYLVSY